VFGLGLGLLRGGGGVVKESSELVILDATSSSSSSEELDSGDREKMLGGGTLMGESAVVDVRGVRTGWYKEGRSEDELASGTGTPYRERGSVWVGNLGLATTPLACAACALTGVTRDGSDRDGEDTERGTNPGGS